MKLKILLLVLGLSLVAAACNKTEPPPTTPPTNTPAVTPRPEPVVVQLTAQNNSGENGTATLTAVDNRTQVQINVSNGPSAAQPAHIHVGACPTPGAVKYPLTNVVAGLSTTVLEVSLNDLLAQLPLAVNIHKSVTEASVYTACGNIGTTSQAPDSTQLTAAEIRMTANGFEPASTTIKKGITVTFINNDTRNRWPASAPHPTHTDYPGFDAKSAIAPGASWTFTFEKVGTWKYHDHLIPSAPNYGTIIVTE